MIPIITGANRGLGLALSKKFIDNQYKPILNCRDKSFSLAGATMIYGDLCRHDTLLNIADIADIEGGNVLINCAGIYHRGIFENTSYAEINKVMEANFIAPVNLTKRLWSQLIKTKGLIVNINSLAGETAGPGEFAYSASKHALKGFFESLQFDATKNGIRIVDVFLGAMKTDMALSRPESNKFIEVEDVADCIFDICKNYKSMRITKIFMNRRRY